MDEIRFVTELYYDIQKMRIMSGNRLGQLERDGMDPRRAQALQDWTDERLLEIEKEIKKIATKYVKNEDIWGWLKDVKGIGPVISACLISWLKPIGRFGTVSALWAYCGQDVRDGRAPKMKKGEKVNWNPRLRALCWKISESFIKSRGPDREIYDQAKIFYREKFPEPVPTGEKTRAGKPKMQYTDLHVHNMAKRKAVKLFLSHAREILPGGGWRVTGEPQRCFVKRVTGLLTIGGRNDWFGIPANGTIVGFCGNERGHVRIFCQ